ncbi:MAG: hypothetical protein CM1200mP10_29260 [Candidatus Neomarinimicrobiota bacterium]|nr:MAG: hypothetical protein CM1200mP10_29260 [Candidatus Neomarinimicrobiota bacterium]
MFRHQSGNFFEDRAALSKIGRPSLMTLTFGLFLFDAELDGDLGLFTANGHVQIGIEQRKGGIYYREPSHLFLNDGDGHFFDIVPSIEGAIGQTHCWPRASYSDYDKNGT